MRITNMKEQRAIEKRINWELVTASIILAVGVITLVLIMLFKTHISANAHTLGYMEKVPNTKWGDEYADGTVLVYDTNTNIIYYYDNDKYTIVTPYLSTKGNPCVLEGNNIKDATTNEVVISTE